jgi:hypothetical protein
MVVTVIKQLESIKMDKVIRDGLVAVLYSPGFGAGWYSWTGQEELLYDPVIVDMVQSEKCPEDIVKYCESQYGQLYFGGVDQLAIQWIPVGTRFYIDEYDGSEGIVTEEDMATRWIVA